MKEGATLPLLLKELRLPAMAKLWRSLAQEANQKGWSGIRYLVALCEYELSERSARKLKRRITESCLPKGKSLETYDFSIAKSLDKAQVLALGTGEDWIEKGMNLLPFGPSGVGKTHLAAGIGDHLVQSGWRVLFTRTTELLQQLQAAKRDLHLPSTIDKLDKYDCLILDDFGYVQKSEAETSLLFELISERYERRSLIITCNQPFQEWDQIFQDRRMAVAAIDRLIHHATVLEVNTESYRRREAKKNQKK